MPNIANLSIAIPTFAAATSSISKALGLLASRFNPDILKNGKNQIFKGGAASSTTEKICKKRYQQIAVTALGIVNSTSSRIL